MLRSIVALNVATSLVVTVGGQTLTAILVPEVGGVAGVGVVGLGGHKIGVLIKGVEVDGEPLVVGAARAFQLVKAAHCSLRHSIQLPDDALAGAREVEEEGNAVGPTDEWVVECRSVVAEEDGVSGADEVQQ